MAPSPRPLRVLIRLLLLWTWPMLACAQTPGSVTLPLASWQQSLAQLEQGEREPSPPTAVLQLDRELQGSFRKGVFTGNLRTRFRVLEQPKGAPLRIPVLDSGTSIGEVLLDGRPTSLLQQGGMYTVGVDQAGEHTVRVAFFQGREDDRFSRQLRFALPPSGPTAVSIWLPEQQIEASLAHGAVRTQILEARGTRVLGQLDAHGLLDLTWKRLLTHGSDTPLRMEVRLNTLYTLHEALVKGMAVFDCSLLEGETDRIDLRLPPDIEVVDVSGDAVLQWYADAAAQGEDYGQLAVLLRYLVEAGTRAEGHDRARIQVHFQFPADLQRQLSLPMPLPPQGVAMTGALGVQGPAGLQADLASAERAEALTLRDLPLELTELTASPLLMGFRFQEAPSVALQLTRQQEVELTSTIVDDIQASTVLMEDGSEVAKLRLTMRNNTRQHLAVQLPAGAQLTHSLLDGQAVRPAIFDPDPSSPGAGEALLFPLRQSQRSSAGGELAHTVQPGDTLGALALHHLGDSSLWPRILQRNGLSRPEDLAVGQQLFIAAPQGIEESSFVVELAYARSQAPLGLLGRRQLELPALDVDVMSVTWHLYLPEHLAPLDFDANLTQYSGIHYSPLQRVFGWLRQALLGGEAWAGGGRYQNILAQRKTIYQEESTRRQGGEEVVGAFPLVGERYRFERILAGREVPNIAVAYLSQSLVPWLRWAALLAAFGLGLLLLGTLDGGPQARGPRRLLAALGFLSLFALAHYVLGIHKRILWGVDAALAFSLLRSHGAWAMARLRNAAASPALLLDQLSWRNLALLLAANIGLGMFITRPLLFGSALLLGLAAWRGAVR